MEYERKRIYHLDGDSLEIVFYYDEDSGQYFGDYPYFKETPRFTPNGRPWVNVTIEGCPHADEIYNDCGSCRYLRKEHIKDLIGICTHKCHQKI